MFDPCITHHRYQGLSSDAKPFFLWGTETVQRANQGFDVVWRHRSSSLLVDSTFRTTTYLYSGPQMECRFGASAHVEFQAADEGDPVRALFLAESVGLLRR